MRAISIIYNMLRKRSGVLPVRGLSLALLFLASSAGIMFSSCTREPLAESSWKGEGLVLSFSGNGFDDVTVSTRSGLPADVENRVVNLYVLIFTHSGDCMYSQFYDASNRVENSFPDERGSYWLAHGSDPSSGTLTNGKIRLSATDLPDYLQGKIYIIANLDTELSTISPSRLSLVKNEDEMLNLVSLYKQSTSDRMGNFVMVGYGSIGIDGENISSLSCGLCERDGCPHTDNVIHLERMDAKVEFKIGIVPGGKTIVQNTEGGVTTSYIQEIESFALESWQVFNLPRGSYLVGRGEDAPDQMKGEYFNSELFSAESIVPSVPCRGYADTDTYNENLISGFERTEYGFSFYMYENRQSAKQHASSYNMRDKRLRNSDGTLAGSDGDMWQYAPEKSTYLRITGEAKLRHTTLSGDNPKESVAELVYYVHLGDFGSSTDAAHSRYDDYSVCRNTHYTYTMNIKGVNSVCVEARKDWKLGFDPLNELQSGSKGDVASTPVDNNHLFDAHFGQWVFPIRYSDFDFFTDPDDLTWYVSSPFGREGVPDRVGAKRVEVPNGLDYKWVWFHINGGEHPQNNVAWLGKDSPSLMDILELANYLRGEVKKKRNSEASDFDIYDGVIYLTAFVNEFYYDCDPISGESRPCLWREFVNRPMRIMHLMCTTAFSKDGLSTDTNGIFTIRQKSIQTIYNVNAATEGWGVESVDELMNRQKFHKRTDHRDPDRDSDFSNCDDYKQVEVNGCSDMNGLYNSAKLWGFLTNTWSEQKTEFVENRQWSHYLDFNVPNGSDGHTDFMRDDDDIATMRYACMMRNRDENANGTVEREEIKWYLASIGQLRHLFIADQGLIAEARLYHITDPGTTGNEMVNDVNGDPFYKWRLRVVSSSLEGRYPLQLWAEEGCSISKYGNEWSTPGMHSIRCVRDLTQTGEPKDLTDPADYPESPISCVKNSDNSYTFDLSKVNSSSLRIKTNQELVPMDQNSLSSRPYRKFTTGPLCDIEALSSYRNAGFSELREKLLKGLSVCPDGYRAPNVREMAIAYNYIPYGNAGNNFNDFWVENRALMCCNYYSFGAASVGGNGFGAYGVGGSNADAGSFTWYFEKNKNNITSDDTTNQVNASKPLSVGLIRCVKDVD